MADFCEHGNEHLGSMVTGHFLTKILVTYNFMCNIKMALFWNVAPCCLAEIDRRFRRR
jgi:hypothetical protein